MQKAKVQAKSENYITRVHRFVCQIPKGKVTTYGVISKVLGINPRMVGWALHQNRDLRVPCHRVVDRTGRLAPNFAFNGWKEQKNRLLAEGVNFKDEMHVDRSNIIQGLS